MRTCSISASASPRSGSCRRSLSAPCFHPSLLPFIGLLLLVGPLLAGPSVQAQAPDSPLQASDRLKTGEIQDLTMSPTGRNVAYTVRETVPSAPESVHDAGTRTRLYMVPSSGRSAPRLLTRSPRDVSDPAWHPDGNQLAFVRPVEGTPQVFVLSLSGGEPYQLTDVPHGATAPQWSPQGDRLLFASQVPRADVPSHPDQSPPSVRPGRSAADTIRRVPPDTLLLLRHAETLDPVDTLAIGPDGDLRVRADTTRPLRTPGGPSVPDALRTRPVDQLQALSADSLRTVFEQLRLRPDTITVPVPPDTAATPDGDLLQARRWLHQHRDRTPAQVRAEPDGPNATDAPRGRYQHYFTVDVPTDISAGSPPRPEPEPATHGYRSFTDASWLPGSTQIVASAPPETDMHPNRHRDRNLYVVDLADNRASLLLDIDGYALAAPRLPPNRTTLAFRAQPLSSRTAEYADIGLFDLDGRSAPQLISTDFDRNVSSFRWSPDGWYLYTTIRASGHPPLYRFAPFARADTAARRDDPSLEDSYDRSRTTFELDSSMVQTAPYAQMLGPKRTVQDIDVTDAQTVYAAAGPGTPSALYTNTVNFGNERRLSSHNADWSARRQLGETEWLTVENEGLSVEGRLTSPPNATDSLQHPLLVVPRGGPPALAPSSPASFWFDRHYLAGHGYAVLEVWPRGSAGYGHFFERMNFQDWGPGPAADVLAVTKAVESRAWVDSTQQVLAGRGYGGTLTAWLAATTDRFRAAIAQSGVYDLQSFFGTGAAWRSIPAPFGGLPWASPPPSPADLPRRSAAAPLVSAGPLPGLDTTQAPDVALRQNAPLSHAHDIETPVLLLHGTDDAEIPASQADALYRRLQLRERPVEYVRYPGVRHNFSASATPAQQIDRLVRLREFLARYTDGPRPAAPPR